MGQLDFNGSGGMLQSALLGKRVSAKNCPLGLAEMTADFVNAYVIGSVAQPVPTSAPVPPSFTTSAKAWKTSAQADIGWRSLDPARHR